MKLTETLTAPPVKAEREPVQINDITPRGGMVTIRLMPRSKDRMKGNIYLPDNPLGDIFEQAEVVKVGRGVLLDSGATGGTDDLKPGMTVLAKIGQRVPSQGAIRGSVVGQEIRSVLALDVEGDENLVLINNADIIGIIN